MWLWKLTNFLKIKLACVGFLTLTATSATLADKPQLVRVLPNLEGPSYQTYFVYSESFKNDRRLEVFRDFLFNEAKDWHY